MGRSRHRVKLSYARDESGEIIPVRKADKQARYTCPECDGEVFVRGGEGTQYIRHFVHAQKQAGQCGAATLHRVTRNVVKETIRENRPLFIQRLCSGCGDYMRQPFFIDTTKGDVTIKAGTRVDRDLPDLIVEDNERKAFIEVCYDEPLPAAKRKRYRKRDIDWVECSTVTASDYETRGLVIEGLSGSFETNFCPDCSERRAQRREAAISTIRRLRDTVEPWRDKSTISLRSELACPVGETPVDKVNLELSSDRVVEYVGNHGWFAPVLVARYGDAYDAFAIYDEKNDRLTPDHEALAHQVQSLEGALRRLGIVELRDEPTLVGYEHNDPDSPSLNYCDEHRRDWTNKHELTEQLRGLILNQPVMIRYCSRCGDRSRHHRFFEPPSSTTRVRYDTLRLEFEHLSCGPDKIDTIEHRVLERVDITERTPSQVLEENKGGVLFLNSRQEEEAILCSVVSEHDPGELGLYQCRKCYDDIKNSLIIKSRSPDLGESGVRISGLETRQLNDFDFITRSFYDRAPNKADIALVDGHKEEALSFNIFLGENDSLNKLPKPVAYLDEIGGDSFVIHRKRGEVTLTFE